MSSKGVLGFCTTCGKEISDNENFCSSCGSNVNQKTSTHSVVTEKRSNFWYLAPILFSIFGGVIAFFILRKPDPSKAKNCLVLGIGFFIIWTAVTMASVTDDSSTEVTQGTIPISKPAAPKLSNTIEFDPKVVAASKKYIPDLQALPLEILQQCRAIDSYSDFSNFITVVGLLGNDLTDVIKDIDSMLTTLELDGYDEHPEVGPLIKETRQIARNVSSCLDDVVNRYG